MRVLVPGMELSRVAFVQCPSLQRERAMTVGTLLLIILILLLLGAVPSWPYSRDWGYFPSGGIGLVLVIVLILVLLGRI
jgi:hypothetical protein